MPPPPAPRRATTVRAASRMLLRAMRLRCPHCGGGPVLETWFRLRDRCPRCRLHLDREESDYFLGAYMVSLLVMECIFALGFLIVLLITWPDPPWEAIQWIGSAVLVASIVGSYPFAKTIWLAIDLMFRPVVSNELGWREGDPSLDEDEVRR